MIPSKTELPNQQFKYIEEAEKTAAVQKVLSKESLDTDGGIGYIYFRIRGVMEF